MNKHMKNLSLTLSSASYFKLKKITKSYQLYLVSSSWIYLHHLYCWYANNVSNPYLLPGPLRKLHKKASFLHIHVCPSSIHFSYKHSSQLLKNKRIGNSPTINSINIFSVLLDKDQKHWRGLKDPLLTSDFHQSLPPRFASFSNVFITFQPQGLFIPLFEPANKLLSSFF